jgi:hypothetical protein
MAAVKGTQKILARNEKIISSIVDHSKCTKLLSTLEKYSTKLDKLIETTSNIEQKSKRMHK